MEFHVKPALVEVKKDPFYEEFEDEVKKEPLIKKELQVPGKEKLMIKKDPDSSDKFKVKEEPLDDPFYQEFEDEVKNEPKEEPKESLMKDKRQKDAIRQRKCRRNDKKRIHKCWHVNKP